MLDPVLSFSPSDNRPYRAHLANIAKPDCELAFGIATDKEGWGKKLLVNIYLIDSESATRIFPASRKGLGDATLAPVFPYDSPEGELMRSVAERVNRLIKRRAGGCR